jgi:hypothetical protein
MMRINDRTEEETTSPNIVIVRVSEFKCKQAPGSKVYHRPSGCRASKRIREPEDITRAEAKKRNLKPCRNCEHPPRKPSTLL